MYECFFAVDEGQDGGMLFSRFVKGSSRFGVIAESALPGSLADVLRLAKNPRHARHADVELRRDLYLSR
jgi:hypothetical protein